MALSERPQSQKILRDWVQAMTPDDEWEAGPGRISVVSFRAEAERPTRCSLYIRPNGYTQEGRRAASPGAETGHRVAYTDPYRA
jgi:hypothetical protein